MAAEHDLDRRLRAALRDTLDRESGPDPVWADSPAARRIRELERRRRFRPIRLLAVAAILLIGGGALVLGGASSRLHDPAPVIANGWIAYTVYETTASGETGDADIYLVALDRPPHRAVGAEADRLDEICPAFSPDGARLAYGRAEKAGPSLPGRYRDATLVVADLDGDGRASDSRTITVGGTFPPPCAIWSPDGHSVAFAVPATSPVNPARSAAGSEVWIVRLVDGHITRLPDLLATDLEWSPDGTELAIASGTTGVVPGDRLSDGLIDLYSVGAQKFRPLATTHGAVWLSWSPDGTRIVYQTDVVSRSELRLVDIATGRDDALVTGFAENHGFGPSWSPLGDQIVYQRVDPRSAEGHDVILLRPGTAGDWAAPIATVVSTPFEGEGRDGFWTPDRLTWSPDGRHLLYVGWRRGSAGTAVVAVPIEPGMRDVVLDQAVGITGDDGYDAAAPVPIQSWGRRPAG